MTLCHKSLRYAGGMEGGGFFPFGGDPEEILRGLREFAETQSESVKDAQREQFATLTLSTAVELTAAALKSAQGTIDELLKEIELTYRAPLSL